MTAQIHPEWDRNRKEDSKEEDGDEGGKEEGGDRNVSSSGKSQNDSITVTTTADSPSGSPVQSRKKLSLPVMKRVAETSSDVSGEEKSGGLSARKKAHRPNNMAVKILAAARQAILLRRSYQWRQNDDTKILASFCPSFLLRRLSSKKTISPETFFGKGACLIADISGFVKLCGRLSALGVNGLDDLRMCTNSFLGKLVETVYEWQGDVVSFAGDAVICVFMASDDLHGNLQESICCQNAIKCAIEIKNYTSVDLSCHVAVSYGDICFAMLGGYEDKWTYLINGDCLTELSDALNDAGSKEAVATSTCLDTANFTTGQITTQAIPNKSSVKILQLDINEFNTEMTNSRNSMILLFAGMNSFVPPPVTASVAAGSFDVLSELRQVTTLFLKLDTYSRDKNRDLLSLQDFFFGVQKQLTLTGAFMRQFLVDDKGCVLIAIWGVPGNNYPNNCSRALHCGVSISKYCQTIGHSCSIGITTGDAYCGTVGSVLRQDYVAMGDSVNLAARLMCKAYGRVLTDDYTYSELPHSMTAILEKGESLQLKGRTEPLSPYVYTGAELPELPEVDVGLEQASYLVSAKVSDLLNKETAALKNFFHDNAPCILSSVTEVEEDSLRFEDDWMKDSYVTAFLPPVRLIVLIGPAGSGKKNAVHLFRQLSIKHKFRYISIRMHQTDCSIPYCALKKLFLELVGPTNFITEQNQREIIDHLLSDIQPDEDLDDLYQRHFPMLKFALKLEWDVSGVSTPKTPVTRAFEFLGDHTFQDVLISLFKKCSTTIVIEDVNFCDEPSCQELTALLDARAPVLMLFTASNSQDNQERRRLQLKSPTKSVSAKSLHTPASVSNFSQVSLNSSTRRMTKSSVYEKLSELEDETVRYQHSTSNPDTGSSEGVTADELIKKQQRKDLSVLRHLPNCVYIKMPPVGKKEVTEILKSTLEVEEVSDELADQVLDLCGGSIYWCMSISHYIKVCGADNFSRQLGSDSQDSPKAGQFSKRLEKHVVYHLETLSVKLQTVAKYASVIGNEFHLAVLFEVLPSQLRVSLHDLAVSVSALCAEGIFVLIQEPSMFAFHNDLIRKTLMDLVLPSDAYIIHQNIAEALLKVFSDDLRPHYSSLSYHFAMSPENKRGDAFKYTVKAADQQIGNGNFSLGFSYIQFSVTFVKYDSELDILTHVTKTALSDMQPSSQQRSQPFGSPATQHDLDNFRHMLDELVLAKSTMILNENEILHSNSFDMSQSNLVNTTMKVNRNKSAVAAKFMKMPSYSAKSHHAQSPKHHQCCCTS